MIAILVVKVAVMIIVTALAWEGVAPLVIMGVNLLVKVSVEVHASMGICIK